MGDPPGSSAGTGPPQSPGQARSSQPSATPRREAYVRVGTVNVCQAQPQWDPASAELAWGFVQHTVEREVDDGLQDRQKVQIEEAARGDDVRLLVTAPGF